MTGRLINYESSACSLDTFLTSSYNLNEPIYINMRPIMWHYLSPVLGLLFHPGVSWYLLYNQIPPLPFHPCKSRLYLPPGY